MKPRYPVAALLCRSHGLSAFKALAESKQFDLLFVATHRKKATFEDPSREERDDFKQFVSYAKRFKVPLLLVDRKNDLEDISSELEKRPVDFLVSVSWRMLIPEQHLTKARLGTLNLHRGALPQYAGNFPLHRAIENGETKICISAHILESAIDSGEIICEQWHPINYNSSNSLDENVERLKTEITPHYGPLLLKGLDMLLQRS